jgi:hypothetical protein
MDKIAQQLAFLDWLDERDRFHWDREMERDFSRGGRGMSLLGHVREQLREGKYAAMNESSSRRRKS